MDNIEQTLKKKNIDKETYEKIINDCFAKMNRESDDEWQDIVDRYNLPINHDHLRKNCTGIFGSYFVKQYFDEKQANDFDDEYLAKLDEKKRELERARIQYRDQRNAWQRQNYADARAFETLSLLEEELKELGKVNFEVHIPPLVSATGKEMIVCLSDLHIGQTFDSIFGKYNSDIAKERLNKYLDKIKEVAELHNVWKVHVVGLGDLLSGSIHKSIAITNKENVIEQIKLTTEYISSFCYELTKIFQCVQFTNVSGNHSRIDRKDDALHNERLDDVIGWAVALSLNHIENFHYMSHRNIDNGIADLSVCNKFYLAVHGDYDSMTKQSVSNICMMVGCFPHAILRGHNHSPAMMEFNGVKVIQSGSLAGSGDDYTVEKRLTGNSSQTLLVCNSNGVECIYNVELN